MRQDDAQAYWLRGVFENVTTTLVNSGIPQTIGLIPYQDDGISSFAQDGNLVAYLGGIIGDLVEIALHGYAHTENEFQNMDLSEANTKIAGGKQTIQTGLNVTTTTFIPPNYVFNNNTVTACANNGFTVFSSGGGLDANDWGYDPAGLLHIPETVQFADWTGEESIARSSSVIIDECQQSLNDHDVCVILIHPQELAVKINATDYDDDLVNQTQYSTLMDVVTWIKEQNSQGVELMTLEQYAATKQ
jgi:peptidoglycan/xylan/chitin deacetylase (PgdA/CDA1 family)